MTPPGGEPPLVTRRAALRPLDPGFVDALYHLASTRRVPWQWRGRPETPEGFRESLWAGVLCQFGLSDASGTTTAGIVNAYAANMFHRHAYVTVILHPDARYRAWPIEGVLLFLNYLYVRYDLWKIYAESAESSFAQFSSADGLLFEVEGRLRGHLIMNGRREDQIILGMSRDRWEKTGARWLDLLT